MAEEAWFRVNVVLPCAFEPVPEDAEIPDLPQVSRPVADAARVVLARVDRTDTALRDVARALVDAIDHLEGELQRLQARLDLADGGVELHSELVQLGADGVHVARRLGLASDDHVRVWLELALDGQTRLVGAIARVLPSTDGTALQFVSIPGEARDRIVAFAFQQQAQERRRDRQRAR